MIFRGIDLIIIGVVFILQGIFFKRVRGSDSVSLRGFGLGFIIAGVIVFLICYLVEVCFRWV